jgi:hypothetical protein
MKGKTFQQRYRDLMHGVPVVFNESEVMELLYYLDYYHINTLQIQSSPKESSVTWRQFICKVDEPTVKAFLKEQNSEMRIV